MSYQHTYKLHILWSDRWTNFHTKMRKTDLHYLTKYVNYNDILYIHKKYKINRFYIEGILLERSHPK